MNSTKDQFSRNTTTGIIFFSRTRNCEARNKKWHPSHFKNLEIAEYLIERTKSVLQATRYDVLIVDETKQHGNSFGEKIRSAFEDTFALGYDQLILVGNDSVGLNEEYINQSIDFLNENAFVFGATQENGLYLIGFKRSFFESKSKQIANLPWKTKHLLRAVSDLTEFHGVAILPVLSDLNSIEDIAHLLKSRSDVFTQMIRVIVHGLSMVIDHTKVARIRIAEFSKINERGPPLVCMQ